MWEWIIKYWLQVGFGLLTAGVGWGFKIVSKKIKESIEERETLKAGVVALLHDRIYLGCIYHIGNKEITTTDLDNMSMLYDSYHGLGGNGTGTDLYERFKKLPLKEETRL